MGLARTRSVALIGLAGSIVEVEADISSQLPGLRLIGLPDAALAEAAERVRAAAKNSGCALNPHKLTVNLSPAALRKHGSGFDLAIALACLAADGVVPAESVGAVLHIGELALDGRLRPTPGMLPAVIAAARSGYRTVMVPAGNADEAALVPGIRVIGVASLRDALIWHGARLEPIAVDVLSAPAEEDSVDESLDLIDVVGNDEAILALQVAAAGGHHVFMLGPPGAGKTMLAARLPGLLPDLGPAASLEVSSLRSLSGRPVGRSLITRPPLEAPHHTITAAAMVGGGSGQIRPGAAARASHGVLFLDEAPEFANATLQALRQPLESGRVLLARARGNTEYPARVQVVLAANPCPCANPAGDQFCGCTALARRRYLARLSGPLMDRIDIQVGIQALGAAQLMTTTQTAEPSVVVAERVAKARAAATARWSAAGWRVNAEVPGPALRRPPWQLAARDTAALRAAMDRGALSARGFDRILRLAWSIADLDGRDQPSGSDVNEAAQLRMGEAHDQREQD